MGRKGGECSKKREDDNGWHIAAVEDDVESGGGGLRMGQTLYIHRYIGQRYNSFCCTRQKCGSHLKDRAKIEGRYSSIPQRWSSKNVRRANSKASTFCIEDYLRENYRCRLKCTKNKFIAKGLIWFVKERKHAFVNRNSKQRRFWSSVAEGAQSRNL